MVALLPNNLQFWFVYLPISISREVNRHFVVPKKAEPVIFFSSPDLKTEKGPLKAERNHKGEWGSASAKQFWERPHYEPCKNVGLEELDMSGSSNDCIQVAALQWDIKVDVASHEHPMLGRWGPYLVQTLVKHLQKYFSLLWEITGRRLAHLYSCWMIWNITILRYMEIN